MGFLLGGLLSGAIGYACITSSYEPPNGNPTEVRFFDFLETGASAFAAIANALFGGSVGAIVGAGASLLFSLRKRHRASQNRSADSVIVKQSESVEG